jgi:hypothetical protein
MVVRATPHGGWHLKLTVVLPNGAEIAGFVPPHSFLAFLHRPIALASRLTNLSHGQSRPQASSST